MDTPIILITLTAIEMTIFFIAIGAILRCLDDKDYKYLTIWIGIAIFNASVLIYGSLITFKIYNLLN